MTASRSVSTRSEFLYRGHEYAIVFQVRPGQLPTTLLPTAADGPQVVLVASQGSTLRIQSSVSLLPVSLDREPPRTVPAMGLQVDNQLIGSHQISFNNGNTQRKLTFETGPTPILNIFLAADPDLGRLSLRSNIDGVRAFS